MQALAQQNDSHYNKTMPKEKRLSQLGQLPEQFYQKSVQHIEEFAHLGRADLHIHSNYSDAKPSIEEILDWVEEKTDLDVIAITDHDTIEGALYAQKIAEKKKYRFEIIIGEEISTDKGHLLGLFLKEKVEPGLSVRDTILKIRDQGGVAIAAHPFNYTRMNGGQTILNDGIGIISLFKEKDYLDGIEVLNATPTRDKENLSAQLVNNTVIFKADVGGSDAHILDAIGMGQTIFEGENAADLKEALLKCQTVAIAKKWRILVLLKYLFFFLPKGLRLIFYTIVHGRRAKRPEMFDH